MAPTSRVVIGLVLGLTVHAIALPVSAQRPHPLTSPASSPSPTPEPAYLKDRGTGVATSLFGTYVRRHELLIYPFFEYDHHNKFEYKPSELGSVGEQDFRGRYRASEKLIFLAYGLTENLAVELEMASIKASLEKSPLDKSTVPAKIQESGLGDVQAELRWRWKQETEHRPEFFSYAEVAFPHHRNKHLIGTPGWEVVVGTGVTRGFKWGTLTGRASIEYAGSSSSKFDVGEFAVEYLKRVSPKWRLYLGVEGTPDELSLVTEAQWHVSQHVYFKFNNGVGLTSKAVGWAPEVGIVFSFPPR